MNILFRRQPDKAPGLSDKAPMFSMQNIAVFPTLINTLISKRLYFTQPSSPHKNEACWILLKNEKRILQTSRKKPPKGRLLSQGPGNFYSIKTT